ncbi:methylthioribose-1-phosphate isomerase [Vreelandella aquamarina]|uniref:Methylthioribose-1-phosphate isomerase n=1 Tax=Vreelandella aquamarina TaxID=77097 RepID=A0A1N6CY84_9GAMM|nr:S-methyl-5-thioribose-1-phosphate isomerase [Halomonas meridiana]GED45887.1 methylthioribose-1-phosphate isomerase [Halomonas meridiana]SIN63384.1 methylthioribose-1-phosphate isomerase [Halomonas meridiana]SIN71421.1 methylthioribose-1-phosphate isomerase [Halomonas meridiana]SIO43390.1 methylthioribose-1-phosphate isomerase [Halomonas meridiana]
MVTLQSRSLRVHADALEYLDQTRLPQAEEWVRCDSPEAWQHAVKHLAIRGAPLIGLSAAFVLAQYAARHPESEWQAVSDRLRATRPTAVNLMYCLDAMEACFTQGADALAERAKALFEEDRALCQRMAERGADLLASGDRVLTHCNTGALATAGVGTAIGALAIAKQRGIDLHVYVDETRPLLQGGRLTAWEMADLGIPYQLITDSMAASLMAAGKVDKVMVGADRICANGDFANKVGTYMLAVAAHYHQVPFYVVAPYTTVDPACATGAAIPIEQRDGAEVRGAAGAFGEVVWAPSDAPVWNPAFDVTPAKLVTAWILDTGVFDSAAIARGEHLRGWR